MGDLMNFCRPGNPARETLDGLQSEIKKAGDAIVEVEKARLPLEDTRARLIRAAESASYRSPSDYFFEGFQNQRSDGAQFDGAPSWSQIFYVFGIEKTVDRIVDRLKAADHPVGLPAAKRPAAVLQLRAKLAALQNAEEIETLRLEDAGLIILRRGDADPAVVLAIWQAQTKKASGPGAKA